MDVAEAVRAAEALLPGEPGESGLDPRWQAIIAVGEHVETAPEAVWKFVAKWGGHSQEDLRNAIACCLLEHLLEFHFDRFIQLTEYRCQSDAMFADMCRRCRPFGQSAEPAHRDRFARLAWGSGGKEKLPVLVVTSSPNQGEDSTRRTPNKTAWKPVLPDS